MANWITIIDRDEIRRREYISSIESEIIIVEGLVVERLDGEGWSTIWACSANAPVDFVTSENKACILWGEARDPQGDSVGAAGIQLGWRSGKSIQWDGYYSAVAVDAVAGELTVGTDVLGLFPVHYWTDGSGVSMVASSPELFRHHPAFSAQFHMKGLVGILLTHGLVSGEGLLRGVRRLTPGKRLRLSGTQTEEIEGFDLSRTSVSNSLPFSAHVDQLYDALLGAVGRLKDDAQVYSLLLSGGLDSRMILVFMLENGIKLRAITQGLAADLEAHCASSVANAYGIPHEIIEPSKANYPIVAALMARWEHVGTGFTNIREWWTQGEVAKHGTRVATGLLADSLLGGTCQSWAYSDEDGQVSRERFMAQQPNLGIAEPILRQLLEKPGHAHLVDQCLSELESEFHAYSDSAVVAAWRYDLAHGQRFHVGGVAWRLSFGAWPVIPLLDQNLLRTVVSIPSTSMADRELQVGLVRDRFPMMARLPLDRSDLLSTDPQFISVGTKEHLELAKWKLRMKMRKLAGPFRRNTEYRYWHRVNNFNGELWRAVRADVDADKPRIEHLFDRDFLHTIIPDPAVKYPPPSPWVSESGRKMLMGLLYWSRDNEC